MPPGINKGLIWINVLFVFPRIDLETTMAVVSTEASLNYGPLEIQEIVKFLIIS
jgi:hypothetical protein